jgi:restriction endonuclease S subunit
MATIKTLEIDLDNTQLLSDVYAQNNQNKMVQVGDIIIARSGVAIGKTALVKNEFDGIFADFTMRIRLCDYNPVFAYYYFRSTYFQYLIEVYKKGLQNTNIFPIVLQEFPLPDISIAEQQCVVNTIQSEITQQDSIKLQITNLREQIDKIIEDALTNS